MPQAHIRGLSQYYIDGLERMEIVIDKKTASPLPYQDRLRIPIKLKVGAQHYYAGIRTPPNMSVVWTSPDSRDNQGKKISLACVLINNGFSKNQKVCIELEGDVIAISPSC